MLPEYARLPLLVDVDGAGDCVKNYTTVMIITSSKVNLSSSCIAKANKL